MIKSVSLINFRNYKEVFVETNSQLVLILGPNAAGKTNFLESIYFLSRLKSFRAPDNLLVKSQEDYFKIVGDLDGKKLETIVQIFPKLARSFKLDDQKVRRTNWKTFATVLFVPQDLNLFDLGPSLRRKFLDQTLSQIDLQYALDLVTLDHVLKQRASLFEQLFLRQASPSDLRIWNEELAKVSVRINSAREMFVEFINSHVSEIFGQLTTFTSALNVVYKGIDVSNEGEFLEKLGQYELGEIRSGQNLYGPHRDDFIIEKDSRENIYNSSRGELRSQILALKLIQARFLDQHRLKPIVLLDDVFSELDETRRLRLVENLKDHQIFITTTEEHHLPKVGSDTLILRVSDNQISK